MDIDVVADNELSDFVANAAEREVGPQLVRVRWLGYDLSRRNSHCWAQPL